MNDAFVYFDNERRGMKFILTDNYIGSENEDVWLERNVDYAPENYGLIFLCSLEYSDRSYCFDTRKVWRRLSDNTLWTARDSGCSCPIAFEDTKELDRVFNIDDLWDEYKNAPEYERKNVAPADWENFKSAIENALLINKEKD